MTSSNSLIDLNRLVATQSGVFRAADADYQFDYSDGADSERRLAEILTAATDLASDSEELAAQVYDWPSEYHLSPTRANLIRPLNLDGVQSVLELGSGCGSITRYLGECDGVEVDAVEGSSTRAELAALRCRGLDNVNIINGNFNELDFPQSKYDLVMFVGVTEYAGRYSECETDLAALQELLTLARYTCKPDGVILIAIENRTGLKYLLGACEDHYGIPFVGVNGYQDLSGIRTYTEDEWRVQLNEAGFEHVKFLLPFPDYKIPTLMVNDDNAVGLPDALGRVQSRDYVAEFSAAQEKDLWQEKLTSGALTEYSNSFLILISSEQSSLQAMADFDMVEYSPQQYDYLGEVTASTAAAGHPGNLIADGWFARLRARLTRAR